VQDGIEVWKRETRHYFDQNAPRGKAKACTTFWIFGKRIIDGVMGWFHVGGATEIWDMNPKK